MDTGYYSEDDISLQPIDISVEEDRQFLYDVILYRWEHHEVVNITHKTPPNPPTYDQHVSYLQRNTYKGIYRICLAGHTIGTVYIDDKNVFSIFILPSLLRPLLKKRPFKRDIKKKLTTMVVHQLMKLNSDIQTFYVGINAKNVSSLNAAKELSCYPLEHIFGCSNIFYKSGG